MPRSERLLFPKREHVEDRRKEGQQRKLLDEFFDHATLVTVSRLITQGQFDGLDYPISTGKEGGVFRATIAGGFRAVKVYRIGNAVFRRLPAYALEALKRESSERNYARLVYAWTRREHTILRRMRSAEVPCPDVYGYLRNVLVMEFIGTEGMPAPRLQDAVVADPDQLAKRMAIAIRKMVVGAKLVHGDLSPYNVLYHEGTPVLIDVAQSVGVDHPQARELLRRDSDNFAKYLKKLGADVDPMGFFTDIGGGELPGRN
ncbi:MAG TPA: RIO1 family regulatory kinase/ATPase [Thermoplasmata archaeon]|nr:RIO1 family regulatory kinase/ATPase [Thermoplasmata archaeon]